MSKKENKDNFETSPNPKVISEDDRENISGKEAKELKAQDKEDTKERGRPKEYNLSSLKRELTKEEKEAFKDLDKDEQRKFIIRKWVQENQSLDKADAHEISLEDEREAGLRPQPGQVA